MKKFLDTLKQINRSADFCYFQDEKAFLPEIEIKALDEQLALPLCKSQAKELIRVARQAPYGKGEKTVVDTNVRNCWEIDGSQLRFNNKAWNKLLSKLLRSSEEYFDMDKNCLDAELYKFLIYEEDGFFLPHQDSEKADNMLATLVICLPSQHEGGELVISHAGDEFVFDSSGKEGLKNFQAAIFYADCQHELKEVKSGYRLCLTYNVWLKDKKGNTLLAPPSSEGQVTDLANQLKNWHAQKDRNSKFVVALNHQYSEANFSFANLKGLDRSQADVLLKAGEQSGLKAHLSLIERYECYDAYETGGYSRRRYWDDDEEEEDIEIGDLLDDSLRLSFLEDPEEGCFSSMALKQEEIINIDSWSKLTAHEEDYEGYTGNAGCSMSYWYRYAAVAFWSSEDEFRLLAESNLNSAVDRLQNDQTLGVKNTTIANQFVIVFKVLEESGTNDSWNKPLRRESAGKFYDCLVDSGDQKMLKKYLDNYAPAYDIEWSRKRLKHMHKSFNEDIIFKFIKSIAEVQNSYRVFNQTLGLVENLDGTLLADKSPILPYLLDMFIKEKSRQLLEVCKLLLENNHSKLLQKLFKHIKSTHDLRSIKSEQLDILKALSAVAKKSNFATQKVYTQWLEENISRLRIEVGEEPEEAYKPQVPDIPPTASPAAKQLLNFMKDEKREKIDFRILKKYRLDLEKEITYYKVDVDVRFDPRPRPQSLLCTKKGAAQRQKIKRYKEYMRLISKYEQLIEDFK